MSLGPLYVLHGEVSVQIFCPFFNWVACILRVKSWEFFIYFGDQTLVWSLIGKYVSPYDWFCFHFNVVFFSHAQAFYFHEITFVYSSFYVPCSRGHIMKILLRGIAETFLLTFSSSTLMVSWLIFKSFIHLEFIFVYGVSWWSSFIFFCMQVSSSPHTICWRGYRCSISCFCTLSIIIDHRDLDLFLGFVFCSIGICVCSYASTRLF